MLTQVFIANMIHVVQKKFYGNLYTLAPCSAKVALALVVFRTTVSLENTTL